MKTSNVKFKLKSAIKAMLSCLLLAGAPALNAQHNHQDHDRPSTHGMLVFGNEEIYFSHLPMFHAPHNYQVLLKMTVPADVVEKYKTAKGTVDYITFVPERFSLTMIGSGELKKFKGSFVAGHFERGGETFAEDVEVEVKEILEFRKFSADDAQNDKTFFLVGTENDAYLVHKIHKAPDFDEVLSIDRLSSSLKPLLAEKSIVPLTISDREDGNPTGDGLFRVWIPEPEMQMPVYSFVKPYYREEAELAE